MSFISLPLINGCLLSNGLKIPPSSIKIRFMKDFLYIYVFRNGTVFFIFKGEKYVFKNPFGEHLSGTLQFFVKDNIVVLFSEFKFVSFLFKNGWFQKNEYKSYPEWPYKCFEEENVIVLSIEGIIMTFTLKNGRFKMRNYLIMNGIAGGILKFVEGTPYFVCCIHPRNSQLIVDAINLITGQPETVLKIGEHDRFSSFKIKNGVLWITVHSGPYCTTITQIFIPVGILWDRI